MYKFFTYFKEPGGQYCKAHNSMTVPKIQMQNCWEELEMKLVCPLLKEWKAESINLSYNFSLRQEDLGKLAKIRFPSLKKLFLSLCDIESIEGLNRMWAPQLTELHLRKFQTIQNVVECSLINTVTDLRKSNWSQLDTLCLEQNGIYELNSLTEMRAIRSLRCSFFANAEKGCCDISVYAKLPKTNNLTRMRQPISGKQEFLINRIKRKYMRLRISQDQRFKFTQN